MKFRPHKQKTRLFSGFTLIELLVCIALIGILSSIMLPAIARAKAKVKRIKCVNNLRQISLAFTMYTSDSTTQEGRLPWQLTRRGIGAQFVDFEGSSRTRPQLKAQIDQVSYRALGINPTITNPNSSNLVESRNSANIIFSLPTIKRELQSAKVLHSPSDPTQQESSEVAEENWSDYDASKTTDWASAQPWDQNFIPNTAISYVLIRGADMARPNTVLATTRNLSADRLDTSKWLGSETITTSTRAMAGLQTSQGNLVLADGSARQSDNSDIGPMGAVVDAHVNSRGGLSIGPSRTDYFGLD